MDSAGVDVALLVSFLLYDDLDYVLAAARRYPDRLAVVAQVDLDLEEPLPLMRSYLEHQSVVGIRLAFSRATTDVYGRLDGGEFDSLFATAQAAKVAVMMTTANHAEVIGPVAERFPEARFVVDHLGLPQNLDGLVPEEPFAGFDKVLDLAPLHNVAVKLTGAPLLSRSGYPFEDLRTPMRRLLDGFTAKRVVWGSDYSRIRPYCSFNAALDWVRLGVWLSTEEKDWVLGRALAQLVRLPHPDGLTMGTVRTRPVTEDRP